VGSTQKYYLGVNKTNDYRDVRNLYYKVLYLLLRNSKKSSIILNAPRMRASFKSVKPYLFLNRTRENSFIPQRPIKSLKLRLRDLGNSTLSKIRTFRQLEKPRRFPQKSFFKSYTKISKRLSYVIGRPHRKMPKVASSFRVYFGVKDLKINLLKNHTFTITRDVPKSEFKVLLKTNKYSNYFLTPKTSKKNSKTPNKLIIKNLHTPVRRISRLNLTPPKLNNTPLSNINFFKNFTITPLRIITSVLYKKLSKRLYLQTNKHQSFVFGNIGMFLVYQSNILKHNPLALKLLITGTTRRQYSF